MCSERTHGGCGVYGREEPCGRKHPFADADMSHQWSVQDEASVGETRFQLEGLGNSGDKHRTPRSGLMVLLLLAE